MSSTNYPLQSKVSGQVHKVKDKEYALEKDLTKLSKRELMDLISRQSDLLENKCVMRKKIDFAINLIVLILELVFRNFPTRVRKLKICTSEL